MASGYSYFFLPAAPPTAVRRISGIELSICSIKESSQTTSAVPLDFLKVIRMETRPGSLRGPDNSIACHTCISTKYEIGSSSRARARSVFYHQRVLVQRAREATKWRTRAPEYTYCNVPDASPPKEEGRWRLCDGRAQPGCEASRQRDPRTRQTR